MDKIPIIIDAKGEATPLILGGKGNMQKNAMEAFIKLQEEIGIQKVVIHSQSRLILELVRKFGGGLMLPGLDRELRLKKETLMGLVGDWELITADDQENNELVLTARKCPPEANPKAETPVDINVNGANSPTI